MGAGLNNIRWLGLLASSFARKHRFPHDFLLPESVSRIDSALLEPRSEIRSCLRDGETVIVKVKGSNSDQVSSLRSGLPSWSNIAFGSMCNLCDTEIIWSPNRSPGEPIPIKVHGGVVVAPFCHGVYRVPIRDFVFEAPLKPLESDNGTFKWVARVRSPPGSATFVFVKEDGSPSLSPDIRVVDGKHIIDIPSDIPLMTEGDHRGIDAHYSTPFLGDYDKLVIPERIRTDKTCDAFRRLLYQYYPSLYVQFALISHFHSPAGMSGDDILYIFNSDWRPKDTALNRSDFIQAVVDHALSRAETMEPNVFLEGFEVCLVVYVDKCRNHVYMNKDLINWALFPRVMLNLRDVFTQKRLDVILKIFPEEPARISKQETFLGLVEALIEIAGSLDEFKRRFECRLS